MPRTKVSPQLKKFCQQIGYLGGLEKQKRKSEQQKQDILEIKKQLFDSKLNFSELNNQQQQLLQQDEELMNILQFDNQSNQINSDQSSDNSDFEQSSANNLKYYGSIIIDIQLLLQFLNEMNSHTIKCNNYNGYQIFSEIKSNYKLNLTCLNCFKKISFQYQTYNQKFNTYNLNVLQVFSSYLSGNGFQDLNKIFGFCGIRFMNKSTFQRIQNNLYEPIKFYSKQNCEKYVHQAIELNKQQIDNDQYYLFTVAMDGAWSRRSYGQKGNSKAAESYVIEQSTQKCIGYDTVQTYCYGCNQQILNHTCKINYTGTINGMEKEINYRIAKKLYEEYKIKFDTIICDGDSSSIRLLYLENRLSKSQIKKYQKSFITSQRGRKSNQLFSFFSNDFINQIIQTIRKVVSIFANDLQTKNSSQLIKSLQQIPFHLLDFHQGCNDEYCNNIKQNKYINSNLNKSIDKIIQKFQNIIISIDKIFNFTTNSCENFHNIRAQLDRAKSRNYIQKDSFEIRTCITSLLFNEHYKWIIPILNDHKLLNNQSQQFILKLQKNYEQKHIKRRLWKKSDRTLQFFDDDYGEIDDHLNEQQITCLFKEMEKYYSTYIKVNTTIINQIEINTQSQSSQRQWYQQRRYRITSSMLGDICKQRKTTHCENLVKQKLTDLTTTNTHLQYGLSQEQTAREIIQQKYNCIINNSGFSISQDYNHYGGSPDGQTIINDEQYIIEIKWISALRNRMKTINQLIESDKKFFIVKCDNSNSYQLNKNHNYYYQIQGNMHCTGIKKCIFSTFTEVDQYFDIVVLNVPQKQMSFISYASTRDNFRKQNLQKKNLRFEKI